ELLSTAAMMVDNGWNQALAGTDINAARAAQYLRTELGTGPDSNLFQVTQADYYNERVGLTALFKNKEALTCSGQPIPDSGLSFSSATAGGNPSLN
ncbi:hypothetical protein J1N39_34400, partial [Pseudomonas aeruginosa]|uniref:hypothetical protein n=1 Tax=Pseudomonas aeruginosa TaxID=287 RepID=UPI001CBFB07C